MTYRWDKWCIVFFLVFMLIPMKGIAQALTAEEIAAKSKPATVRVLIEVSPGDNKLLEFYNFKKARKLQEPVRIKVGTGVIIHEKGLILTAYHVVFPLGFNPPIYIRLPKEGDQLAEVVATDKERQLACLKINKFDLPYLSLGDSRDKVRVGNDIYTMGFPFAAETSEISDPEPTFTEGKVSAFKQSRTEAPFIQTNAAINPGNAGGAMLNNEGEIIGIVIGSSDRKVETKKFFSNSWLADLFGDKDIPIGIGFASPIDPAKDMLRGRNVAFHLAQQEKTEVATIAAEEQAKLAALKKAATTRKILIASIVGVALIAIIAVILIMAKKKKAAVVVSQAKTDVSSASPSSSSLKSTSYSFGNIKCTGGELQGKSFPIVEKGLSIGRGAGNDVALSSDVISRKHAWIGPVAGELVIKDMESGNGTFVNDKQLTGTQPLRVGDVIRLSKSGQDMFTFMG